MVELKSLQGEWTRSLITWPDGRRDESTHVTWLQGPSLYADLRQPDDLNLYEDVAALRELNEAQLNELARQEGFAGVLIRQSDCFEWTRLIDYQPKPRWSDRGTLVDRGTVMIETGYDIAYTEHWQRGVQGSTAALCLVDPETTCRGIMVSAGNRFMYARGRTTYLGSERTLADCVSRAGCLQEAQDLVDCEVSLGAIGTSWQIVRSTLPWRVGADLMPRRFGSQFATSDISPDGTPFERIWTICAEENGFSARLAPESATEPCGG